MPISPSPFARSPDSLHLALLGEASDLDFEAGACSRSAEELGPQVRNLRRWLAKELTLYIVYGNNENNRNNSNNIVS